MTSACRAPCCSATQRLTISELLDRGLRRNRAAPLVIEGAPGTDAEGNAARFSIDVSAGKIAAVGFRATSCATLIAYCEFIAEITPGFRLEIAKALTAVELIDRVPGVPPLKRERAILAVAAFRSAIAQAEDRGQTIEDG